MRSEASLGSPGHALARQEWQALTPDDYLAQALGGRTLQAVFLLPSTWRVIARNVSLDKE